MNPLKIDNFDQLQNIYGQWSEATFPQNDLRSWCNHIRDEVTELEEGNDPLEAADIVLMLIDHAARNKYSLLDAIKVKFDMIKGRTWKPQNDLGIVKHETKSPMEQLFMDTVYDGTQQSLDKYKTMVAEFEDLEELVEDLRRADDPVKVDNPIRTDRSWQSRGDVGTHMFK